MFLFLNSVRALSMIVDLKMSDVKQRLPWETKETGSGGEFPGGEEIEMEEVPLLEEGAILEEAETFAVAESAFAGTAEGVFVGAEAAGAALDSTGVLAPIGVVIGVLSAIGYGVYEIYQHIHKVATKTGNLHKLPSQSAIAEHINNNKEGIDQQRVKLLNKHGPIAISDHMDVKQNELKKYHPQLVFPFSKHIGPGNKIDSTYTSVQDQEAREHDIQYSKTNDPENTKQADKIFIDHSINNAAKEILPGGNPLNFLESSVSALGIAAKQQVEKYTGQLYPPQGKMPAIGSGRIQIVQNVPNVHVPYKCNQPRYNAKTESQKIKYEKLHPKFIPCSGKRLTADDQPSSSSDKRQKVEITGNQLISPPTDAPPQQAVDISSSTDVEMTSLPGTAQGQGGSGDGNANSGMPLYKSVVPYTHFGSKVTTYRKVHRLMTFGLSHNQILTTLTAPAEVQIHLTTFLGNIPWNKPYFYMTPGEYNILGHNAKAKSMRISIVHRGNRIAFQTASSDAQLATLNNIQNLGVAYGLNKTGFGMNIRPTAFDSANSNPMVPTAFDYGEYDQNYINSWYGFPQNNAAVTTEIPDVQLGYKSMIRTYFAMTTQKDRSMGYPSLAKHVQFFDAKTTINQVVGQFEYHPKLAPLKKESEYLRFGLPNITNGSSTVNIQSNRGDPHAMAFDINNTNGQNQLVEATAKHAPLNSTGATETALPTGTPVTSLYILPIEKANYMKKGAWSDTGDKSHIQPSIHVGVQPIPALSTADLLGDTRKFTDAQADFEIVAEMEVDEGMGTDFAWSSAGNKAFGDITMVGQAPAEACCVIGNRQPNNTIRIA